MKTANKAPKMSKPKLLGQYTTVEAFRQAKLREAVETTKHIDWAQVKRVVDK